MLPFRRAISPACSSRVHWMMSVPSIPLLDVVECAFHLFSPMLFRSFSLVYVNALLLSLNLRPKPKTQSGATSDITMMSSTPSRRTTPVSAHILAPGSRQPIVFHSGHDSRRSEGDTGRGKEFLSKHRVRDYLQQCVLWTRCAICRS